MIYVCVFSSAVSMTCVWLPSVCMGGSQSHKLCSIIVNSLDHARVAYFSSDSSEVHFCPSPSTGAV